MADYVNNFAEDIQCQPKGKCKDFVTQTIATDESTDVTYIAKLPAFIRDVNDDLQLVVNF